MTEANKLVTQIEKLGEKLDEVRAMISQVFIGQDRVVAVSYTHLTLPTRCLV